MPNQRARSTDAKAQRAEDLLEAAESLALELGGVRYITLAPVTERAGLHRTGVRRYYASKEELLLELAERGWRQWRDAIDLALEGLALEGLALKGLALEGKADVGPHEIADVLTQTLASLPVFCDCLTHVALNLEGDVSIERARRYKTNSFIEHDAIVDALAGASSMSLDQIRALVPAAAALAASFWQIAHPTPSLAELYRQEPAWGHVAYDFEPKLMILVESTALGLIETLPSRGQ